MNRPSLEIFSHPKDFADAVTAFLRRDEAGNNVLLGVLDTLVHRPEVFKEHHLAALRDISGNVDGAVWMTPPYAFGMTELQGEQIKLAVDFAKTIHPLPKDFFGATGSVEAFKDLWTEKVNKSVSAKTSMRMFEAKNVIEPKVVAGSWRLANVSDQNTLADWTYGYSVEVKEPLNQEQAKTNAEQAIQNGSRYVWEVDGVPVTMTGCIAATPSSSRIAWVYTPKNARGKGYASNLVARVTDSQLKQGKKVFLYTDLANPTSNKIYQNIGFRPLNDFIRYTF